MDKRQSVSKAFIDNSVNCYNVQMRKSVWGLKERLNVSENTLLGNVMCSTCTFIYSSKLGARWNTRLYLNG